MNVNELMTYLQCEDPEAQVYVSETDDGATLATRVTRNAVEEEDPTVLID